MPGIALKHLEWVIVFNVQSNVLRLFYFTGKEMLRDYSILQIRKQVKKFA